MSCRYPGCLTHKLQRFGMCNKHRKWVEKGYIDLECNKLKEMPDRPDYSVEKCRVEGCLNKPRRNFFCERHSSAFQAGVYAANGERLKPLVRYSKDFQCLKCGRSGKITKGFCRTHYQQLSRGLIDFDGNPKREPKRMKYDAFSFCKVKGCRRKPRVRGFCASHGEAKAKGIYDDQGNRLIPVLFKNAGKNCLECERPASIRLLCPMHYYRKYQSRRREFKNKGKICSAIGCKKDAHCLGLCVLHYSRRKARLKAVLLRTG